MSIPLLSESFSVALQQLTGNTPLVSIWLTRSQPQQKDLFITVDILRSYFSTLLFFKN